MIFRFVSAVWIFIAISAISALSHAGLKTIIKQDGKSIKSASGITCHNDACPCGLIHDKPEDKTGTSSLQDTNAISQNIDMRMLGFTYYTNRTALSSSIKPASETNLVVECFLSITNKAKTDIEVFDTESLWLFRMVWLYSQPAFCVGKKTKTYFVEEVQQVLDALLRMKIPVERSDDDEPIDGFYIPLSCKLRKGIFTVPARSSISVKIIFPLNTIPSYVCGDISVPTLADKKNLEKIRAGSIFDVAAINYSFIFVKDAEQFLGNNWYRSYDRKFWLDTCVANKRLNKSNMCWNFITNANSQVYIELEHGFNPDMNVDIEIDYNRIIEEMHKREATSDDHEPLYEIRSLMSS
jgi:hypothetical protein